MFTVPASAARRMLCVDTFLGVDFTNEAGNVDVTRSPYAENMLRDVPGKVRKCMGWQVKKTYPARINGFHRRRQDAENLCHAGTVLYKGDTALYSQANDAPSRSFQLGDRLALLDGKALLLYDGTAVTRADAQAYVPTLTIARPAAGGGTAYEALNLLSPRFRECFAAGAADTVFQLSFGGLDAVESVEVMNASGVFVKKTAGTDYSVDLAAGSIVFVTAPGASPVSGEDNVRVTAARTVEGYAERINHCTVGALFGVAGAADRLFVSGNGDWCNYDWFSAQNDASYFADTDYGVLGGAASAVVGYSLVNNCLAAHKDERETGRNILLRQGELTEQDGGKKPVFPIVNTLQGPGAAAPGAFGYLCTEPLFLTRLGVYALTPSDISGERYSQMRSFFLNGRLLAEPSLENAVCAVFNNMYWLCLNGHAYILDGLQPVVTDAGAPYSTRQYAGFYRTNLPARTVWDGGDSLYFGDDEGRVCRFFTDKTDPASYADDGAPVACCWTTPDFSGQMFYKNKSFRYLAVKLSSAAATGVRLSCMRRGIWEVLREAYEKARYLSFLRLTFSKFSFSCDTTNRVTAVKTRLSRADKTRYRFENDRAGEPFGLMEYAFEYGQNGNYRG